MGSLYALDAIFVVVWALFNIPLAVTDSTKYRGEWISTLGPQYSLVPPSLPTPLDDWHHIWNWSFLGVFLTNLSTDQSTVMKTGLLEQCLESINFQSTFQLQHQPIFRLASWSVWNYALACRSTVENLLPHKSSIRCTVPGKISVGCSHHDVTVRVTEITRQIWARVVGITWIKVWLGVKPTGKGCWDCNISSWFRLPIQEPPMPISQFPLFHISKCLFSQFYE